MDMRITTLQIAVAAVCGGLSIALSYTPIGFISVPNISGAATTLHIPAIVAGVVAGPVAGGLAGLVLAIMSWARFGGIFMQFAGGKLLVALAAAFLPRMLIGVVAYYAYRALRGNTAAIVAALLGTSANTAGVLGILLLFGTSDFRTGVVPIILLNYPFEVLFAAVVAVPVFAPVGRSLGDVDGVGISSVVPPLLDTLDRLARTYLGTAPLVVGPGVRTGMRILYENPKEVGADRICNAVAAYAKYGGPVIVVDLGTATTFSVVSAEGDFVGGAIAPGIGISVDALAEHAAQLHRVELVRPRQAIGRSTVTAMQAGILFGFVGQVEEVLRRMQDELGAPAGTIATGGWADLIIRELRGVQHHEPLLGLEGLRIIFERNRDLAGERNREAAAPLRDP